MTALGVRGPERRPFNRREQIARAVTGIEEIEHVTARGKARQNQELDLQAPSLIGGFVQEVGGSPGAPGAPRWSDKPKQAAATRSAWCRPG